MKLLVVSSSAHILSQHVFFSFVLRAVVPLGCRWPVKIYELAASLYRIKCPNRVKKVAAIEISLHSGRLYFLIWQLLALHFEEEPVLKCSTFARDCTYMMVFSIDYFRQSFIWNPGIKTGFVDLTDTQHLLQLK